MVVDVNDVYVLVWTMIYIARHGQTDWNVARRLQGGTDIPLNATGRAQAKDAGADLKSRNIKIDQIISSPKLRAAQTAEIINENIGAPLIHDERLRERCFGELEGQIIPEITEEQWGRFRANPKSFGAETFAEVFDRVKELITGLDKTKTTLLVSHAVTIRVILYAAKHQTYNEDEFMANFWNLQVENAKIIEYN